ncbi:cbde155e-907c-433b-bf6b-35807606f4f5 [Thermothielavioides terrestris]|uniref:Cbde155e-907c-433b-bf6b-35807606f4f5 n=1 Tax=Thermothielavioides terrestris TaxID=2587410 RepID=A0A446BKR8_9PEZI|nr:cbde155e-907c-433b-bf6b-35807606f4f5 [Thermothielavioides terrestris]
MPAPTRAAPVQQHQARVTQRPLRHGAGQGPAELGDEPVDDAVGRERPGEQQGHRHGGQPDREARHDERAREDRRVRIEPAAAQHGAGRVGHVRALEPRVGDAQAEPQVQQADHPGLDDAHRVHGIQRPGGAGIPGAGGGERPGRLGPQQRAIHQLVQRHQRVKLHQRRQQQREDDEGEEVGVDDARGAQDGLGRECGRRDRRDRRRCPRPGGLVDGRGAEERIGGRAEHVDADAEGVDVISADVGREQPPEQPAAKDQRHDGDGDARDGRKHPDEQDEEEDADAEVGRHVDELVLRGRVDVGGVVVRQPVGARVVLGDGQEDVGALGDLDLVRGRRAHEPAVRHELPGLDQVRLAHPGQQRAVLDDAARRGARAALEDGAPAARDDAAAGVDLEEPAAPGRQGAVGRVGRQHEAALLVDAALAEEEPGEAQRAGAAAEPPGVHGVQAVGRAEEADGQRHQEVVEEQVEGELEHRLVGRVADRQHARQGEREAPDDAAQAHHDERAVDQGREQDLTQLRRHVALEHVAHRVELRVVWVADEVEHPPAHDLAAHGHEEGEVEHVARADEPVHEDGRDGVARGEAKPRADRGTLKQRQQRDVEQHAAVEREDEHLDADDQHHLHDAARLVQPVDQRRLPLLGRPAGREWRAAAQPATTAQIRSVAPQEPSACPPAAAAAAIGSGGLGLTTQVLGVSAAAGSAFRPAQAAAEALAIRANASGRSAE